MVREGTGLFIALAVREGTGLFIALVARAISPNRIAVNANNYFVFVDMGHVTRSADAFFISNNCTGLIGRDKLDYVTSDHG